MLHKVKIAVVDDHPIVIQGLKIMLEKEANFELIGTFTLGKEVLDFIKSNEVDIVLLDITLPDSNGTEICTEIKKLAPKTSVLMLSNRSERSIIMQCIQNGASGYLLKNATIQELKECIFGALTGEIVFCNEVKEIISKPSKNELVGIPRLTKREKEILKHLAEGKTSNMIAEELFLSPLTLLSYLRGLQFLAHHRIRQSLSKCGYVG